MYEVQHLTKSLREGRVEDGPPYPLPGNVYLTHSAHPTLHDALEAITHKGRWTGTRFVRSEYRIVLKDALGRIRKTFDSHGVEQLPTRKRVPVAA